MEGIFMEAKTLLRSWAAEKAMENGKVTKGTHIAVFKHKRDHLK